MESESNKEHINFDEDGTENGAESPGKWVNIRKRKTFLTKKKRLIMLMKRRRAFHAIRADFLMVGCSDRSSGY